MGRKSKKNKNKNKIKSKAKNNKKSQKEQKDEIKKESIQILDKNPTSKRKKRCSTSSSSMSPSKDHHNRSPSKDHRNGSPSKDHHNRSSSRKYRNRSPFKDHHNRSPSKDHHNRSPSKDHHNRSSSRKYHNGSPSKDHHVRLPSKDHRNRSPSKDHRNRSPSNIGKNQDESSSRKNRNRSNSKTKMGSASTNYKCVISDKRDNHEGPGSKDFISKSAPSSSNKIGENTKFRYEESEEIKVQGLGGKKRRRGDSFGSTSTYQNELRSSTLQQRMNCLSLTSIESDVLLSIDFDNFIKGFSRQKHENDTYGKKTKWSETNSNIQDQNRVTNTEIELFFGWKSPFSQHHPCIFKVKGKTYNCAEQYYMSQKAATFNDTDIESKVMSSSDPKKQKRFGKQIKNFDDARWKSRASQVVLEANLAKFEQNRKLLIALFSTGDSILAEASPYDSYWGIGLSNSDPRAKVMTSWRGSNELGKILMDVRTKLRNLYSNITEEPSERKSSNQNRAKESWTDWNIECQSSKNDVSITLFFGWQNPFSQHHPCSFTVNGQMYNCAEQYYMSQKAATFNDQNIEWKVMNSSDPKEQKRFGKQIRGFDDAKWKNRASQVVLEANLAKFGQNRKLLIALLSTGDSILAEASPYDRYWGIGLSNSDPRAKVMTSWCGQNILGKILMEVRTKLRDSSGSSGL